MMSNMKYHLTYHSCNYPPDIVNKHRTIRHSWTYCVTISWRVLGEKMAGGKHAHALKSAF